MVVQLCQINARTLPSGIGPANSGVFFFYKIISSAKAPRRYTYVLDGIGPGFGDRFEQTKWFRRKTNQKLNIDTGASFKFLKGHPIARLTIVALKSPWSMHRVAEGILTWGWGANLDSVRKAWGWSTPLDFCSPESKSNWGLRDTMHECSALSVHQPVHKW